MINLKKTIYSLAVILLIQVPPYLCAEESWTYTISGEPYVEAFQFIAKGKPDQAKILIKQLAEKGDVKASYLMGLACAQEPTKSFFWFKQSAEQGHLPSMWFVFNALSEGRGVKKDEKEASVWLMKLAESGDPIAQEFIYVAYRDGAYGLEKNDEIADYWQFEIMKRNRSKSKSAQPSNQAGGK